MRTESNPVRAAEPSRPSFLDSLASYPPASYEGISLGELAAFGVKLLSENRVDCSYENLTVALFKLFPEKFSLVGYQQFPDGDRVSNTIRLDAQHGGYVVGGRNVGYRLTDRGKTATLEIENRLRGGGSSLPRPSRNRVAFRSRAVSFVKEIERSQAYRKWASGKTTEISRYELTDMLHGTLDTSPKLLLGNLEAFLDDAELVRKREEYRESGTKVAEFLMYVKAHWEGLIRD